MKGALYPETRHDSSNLTSRSAGDTRLTAEPGCLFAKDCDARLASAHVTIAKRRAVDATETAGVNSRNLEDSLAAENSVQDQRPSHAQCYTSEQSCEANDTSAGSTPRRLGTSSEAADLPPGQENTNLFDWNHRLDFPRSHNGAARGLRLGAPHARRRRQILQLLPFKATLPQQNVS